MPTPSRTLALIVLAAFVVPILVGGVVFTTMAVTS